MSAVSEKKVHITPLQNGTSLDHLKPGTALKILEVLKTGGNRVSVAMNVDSRLMLVKDLIFIEGKEISKEELDKIALIGKGGTLNIIKNAKVVRKEQIHYPEVVHGIMKCINPNCITNKEELETKFHLTSTNPLKAKCYYCEVRMEENEIINSIK